MGFILNTKFEVGDKVIGLPHTDFEHRFTNSGALCRVMQVVDEEYMSIKILQSNKFSQDQIDHEIRYGETNGTYRVKQCDFRKPTSKEMKEFIFDWL